MARMGLALLDWWANWRRHLLWLAVIIMILAGSLRFAEEVPRLLWDPGQRGAHDLKLRHDEVVRWFAGKPVYGEMRAAVYPPATYALLWPFLGWLDEESARWFWALTSLTGLVGVVCLALLGSSAGSIQERFFVALIPLSMYATWVTIGNGQLVLHVLPALVAGLVLLHADKRDWRKNCSGAALVLFALVKPNLALPFCFLAMLAPAGLASTVIILLGYGALTLLAASFQEQGLLRLLDEWLTAATSMAHRGAGAGSYANLHAWLTYVGLEQWYTALALAVAAVLGLWTYRHRQADLWVIMGVTALVARLWTYHRVYDDLLCLLPMVSLFRIAKQSEPACAGAAGMLLALLWAAALGPARLHAFPPPWNVMFESGQAVAWLLALIFLIDYVRRCDRSSWEFNPSA